MLLICRFVVWLTLVTRSVLPLPADVAACFTRTGSGLFLREGRQRPRQDEAEADDHRQASRQGQRCETPPPPPLPRPRKYYNAHPVA